MGIESTILLLLVLIMSVVIHEVSHGYAAEYLGDPTARLAGRLTLNPIPHIDPIGSLLVPITMLVMTGGQAAFGWAKPVPYNPSNLKNERWGTVFVGSAGVLANLFLALVFGLIIRFGIQLEIGGTALYQAAITIVMINLVLAVFNMIPIPPLDGSKVLFAALSYRYHEILALLERYSLFALLIVIFFGWDLVISPIVSFLFSLITGLGFG